MTQASSAINLLFVRHADVTSFQRLVLARQMIEANMWHLSDATSVFILDIFNFPVIESGPVHS